MLLLQVFRSHNRCDTKQKNSSEQQKQPPTHFKINSLPSTICLLEFMQWLHANTLSGFRQLLAVNVVLCHHPLLSVVRVINHTSFDPSQDTVIASR
jgi:hypothetical protein